jgi:cytochrome c peroxidase
MPPPFRHLATVCITSLTLSACTDSDPAQIVAPTSSVVHSGLDHELRGLLSALGFTGRIGSTLEARLGRRIDRRLADIGRLLWFDPIGGLNDDNTCGGCHSPTHGFGDSQPIAIGIDNNLVVGPGRAGPRNQEGTSLSYLPHLLTAQAFIPPTERVEAAGFTFPGDNDDIRAEVLRRLNKNDDYRRLFARVFQEMDAGGPITFDHFGRAIAEFEFTQVYTNAPIDRYARGKEVSANNIYEQGWGRIA